MSEMCETHLLLLLLLLLPGCLIAPQCCLAAVAVQPHPRILLTHTPAPNTPLLLLLHQLGPLLLLLLLSGLRIDSWQQQVVTKAAAALCGLQAAAAAAARRPLLLKAHLWDRQRLTVCVKEFVQIERGVVLWVV